jgi:hypothetical protein
MERLRIAAAFGFDPHFKQYGFSLISRMPRPSTALDSVQAALLRAVSSTVKSAP